MRVLLSGASSFTGLAFASALSSAGHDVVAPLQRSEADYSGLRMNRIAEVRKRAEVVWSAPFGSEAFVALATHGAFDALCHHAAFVENYRSPDFDVVSALSSNVAGLKTVLETLQANGLRGVVLTGSVFEADEGAGEHPLRAFSPYGLSKTLTAQVFRYWCSAMGLTLGKFIIPNPFGPFEEPRFCAYLHKTWKSGGSARVNTPDYVRDNIHVDLLASAYSGFVEEVARGGGYLHRAPSGYVESQGSFTRRVARELGPRLGLPCEVELATQTDFSEPVTRINTERAAGLAPWWSEAAAWDAYAAYLKSTS